jgi:hypothetical protein
VVATVDVGIAGYLGDFAWDTLLNQYPTSSNTAIGIGSGASSASDLKLTFDKPMQDPYFYVLALNGTESITFYNPLTIVQSRGISVSGSTITGSGFDSDIGFVAQFHGVYSQINFKHTNNTSAWADSFVFTTGGTPAVPGPLPILGVGTALSQGRKLRRLIHQRGGRRFPIG